jgi:quercetin dioxygenase-like cupin family protein
MTKLSIAIAVAATLGAPLLARAQEVVPDALSVEWQGKKPCENLHEDAQIRILRCTFPPKAMHLRHQHPANFVYVLSGGKVEARAASGAVQVVSDTDAYAFSPPIPWHEATNTGDTTLRYIVVEMKYQR